MSDNFVDGGRRRARLAQALSNGKDFPINSGYRFVLLITGLSRTSQRFR
jgi:hypothetical protein